ncbi:major facilitator superfamily domain-containing protein [Xylaria bambusicola]|uniref:major facilitator superfamily domain-containing protein n=1 Tax=Xylaria bambusicola TaxID=326684 RepID=UPI002008148C|nr:major facilitator superfamily domain-containing protein [Xylaria bambusicola]KAI0526238.1 major facilitator superfamily domain-containing protein [Xylaria bambusicola]
MPLESQTPPPSDHTREPYSIFDKRQKWLIVLITSTAATFSGFASNIYFPALSTIAHDLEVSLELINLTVTSYLIFQGITPSFWGPLSDAKGRRITYCFTFLVFLGACVGLAESRNYATVIVLRSLQSAGSASTIAIGAAVIGDITTREERGGFMGVFQAGLLAPVAIGPVIGGALTTLGWRAIFWFLTTYSAVFLVLLTILLPETLRSAVSNGSVRPSNLIARFPLIIYQKTTKVEFSPQTGHVAKTNRIDLTGPFRILFSKQAAPIIVFLGIYYAVWQMTITAMSTLFQSDYDLTETQVGVTYIANGVGSIVGTLITGRILDADYRRVKDKHESRAREDGADNATFPLEKARLRLVPIFAALQCASVLIFGWTIQYSKRVHIAVPIITTFFTGWALVSTQSVIMTYMVDIFPDQKAAASASMNLARCLLAAGGTSIVMPLINAVGSGWTFTITVAALLVALVGIGVQWQYGKKWRMEAEAKKKLENTRAH